MKNILLPLLFLGSSLLSFSQLNTDSLQLHYNQKIAKYLDKENALQGYYAIDNSGISIFESPEKKDKKEIEYKVYWSELDWLGFLFKNFSLEETIDLFNDKKDKDMYDNADYIPKNIFTDSLLKGLRIAIDPGHLAANIEEAKLERKYIDIKAGADLKQDAQFIEAQLTFATAVLLKQKLEKEGAIVMLTRNKIGENALGISYEEWLKTSLNTAIEAAFKNKDITEEEMKKFTAVTDKKEIFRKLFVNLETKERARKINAFLPDLTLVVHYNVDENNTDWKKPTNKNFNMTFTGGSFMKNDLEKPAYRIEFLRLLLLNDLEKSIDFSSSCIKSFEIFLNVPTAKESDAAYLKQYCMPTEKSGVFCRNLTLTRMVHGTLVYGETLYQDNINELKLLTKNDLTVNGVTTSNRVQQVANAYYEGIISYLKNTK